MVFCFDSSTTSCAFLGLVGDLGFVLGVGDLDDDDEEASILGRRLRAR